MSTWLPPHFHPSRQGVGSGSAKDLGFWHRRRWGGKGTAGRGASAEGRGGVCTCDSGCKCAKGLRDVAVGLGPGGMNSRGWRGQM